MAFQVWSRPILRVDTFGVPYGPFSAPDHLPITFPVQLHQRLVYTTLQLLGRSHEFACLQLGFVSHFNLVKGFPSNKCSYQVAEPG